MANGGRGGVVESISATSLAGSRSRGGASSWRVARITVGNEARACDALVGGGVQVIVGITSSASGRRTELDASKESGISANIGLVKVARQASQGRSLCVSSEGGGSRGSSSRWSTASIHTAISIVTA